MDELVTITIITDGAAFEDCDEIARILSELADSVRSDGGIAPRSLRDVNGVDCGFVDVEVSP